MRFGVLGCGSYGVVHAKVISSMPDQARLVAVADAVPDRAAAVAGELGCEAVEGLEALCRRADVDAISVSIPHGLHADAVVTALEAGKHVLVEKPLDISLVAADRVIEAERRTGLTVGVMSQRRFEPAAVRVKAAIDAGDLGRLTSGMAETTSWRPQSYYDSTPWRGTAAVEGGGALMTLGVHSLDLLLWFLGEPVAVQAQAGQLAHERIEVEDTLVGTVRFASGAVAGVSATTAAYPGRDSRVAVYGDLGSAQVGERELGYLRTTRLQPGTERVAETAAYPEHSALSGGDAIDIYGAAQAQYRDFVAAVRDGRPPAIGTADGRRVLATVLGLYESARTGDTVKL
ncbi:Gfo/Idh/MocA family oxidoreductase [Catenulispora sp. NF23]|uniref:Gfo/Idh/MocA family oxidoreductase n=1 Tax=Catenulispora pinistramenti TaxID=2705254 RepID=A0ABS5KPN3_9ACTN|nr:Gfo/Idh/MocA family oxidoreductase [Catenulispora pinistramenti]MBS2535208.1 Gfo/Idh/MocA family oxidoreductase [Catenulispora pinistramenti]MBS2548000.1 Gfo/Idh/MocA family oxidoreductase [Catenulispora pinistramenti]